MGKIDFGRLDNVTKILLVLLIGAISYFAVFSVSGLLFPAQQLSMMDMMRRVMSGNIAFSNDSNIISIIISLAIALIVSYNLFKQGSEPQAKHDKEHEYKIIRKALSDDEKRILDEVKKAGRITQDSLRFRLGWSKAKVSTILGNLDRIGLIQRERVGKTYRVHLQA